MLDFVMTLEMKKKSPMLCFWDCFVQLCLTYMYIVISPIYNKIHLNMPSVLYISIYFHFYVLTVLKLAVVEWEQIYFVSFTRDKLQVYIKRDTYKTILQRFANYVKVFNSILTCNSGTLGKVRAVTSPF